MSISSVENLLTVKEALAHLRISRTKLHQLVRCGELKAVKFGRKTLFRSSAIQAVIEAHEEVVEVATLVGRRH